jgi:Cu2+-exporting ATPase
MDHMAHHNSEAAHQHTGPTMPAFHGRHDRHAGHSVAIIRDKFWLSLSFTMPVVFWSPHVQQWLGYKAPSFTGSKLISPVLGTVVFIYGGLVFIQGARGTSLSITSLA